MTAITLNLLAEEQSYVRSGRLRSLMRIVGFGSVLFGLAAAAGWNLTVAVDQQRVEADARQQQLHMLESRLVIAQARASRKAVTVPDDLSASHRLRPLCAPQLALLKDVVPNSIQLTQVGFASSAESGGTLTLRGRAVGDQPEIDVDAFLETLRSNASVGEEINQVQLRSLARVTCGGAEFVIECQYKERT